MRHFHRSHYEGKFGHMFGTAYRIMRRWSDIREFKIYDGSTTRFRNKEICLLMLLFKCNSL